MNNNKRQVISIISNILSVFVSIGVSFFLTPYLVGTIGKEAYSYYPLANNFVSYMTIITLALNSMASRFITIEITRENEAKAHKYFSSVFYSNIILSLALVIPMSIIIIFLDRFLNVSTDMLTDVRLLFSCTFVSMLVNLVSSVFGIATFAKNRMDWRAKRDIGQTLLRAALLLGLFSLLRPSIVYFGLVAVSVSVVNGLVQYIFTRKLMPGYRVTVSDFDKTAVFELVKSGIWNSVNNIGSVLTMSVSVLIANIMIGASESGDLSIVQTLPHLISSVITAVYGVLLARITSVFAKNNKEKTIECVRSSQQVLGFICSVPAVLVIILGKVFFRLWVPGEDAVHLQILSSITMLPVFIHSTMWTIYGLNVTNNKLKTPALTLIGTGIFSIVLTVLLVHFTDLGTYAITISSSICNGMFYLFFIPFYAAKKMDTPVMSFYSHIMRSFICAAVLLLIGLPAMAVLEQYVTSWIALIICGGFFEMLGLALYWLIVLDRTTRRGLSAALTERVNAVLKRHGSRSNEIQ